MPLTPSLSHHPSPEDWTHTTSGCSAPFSASNRHFITESCLLRHSQPHIKIQHNWQNRKGSKALPSLKGRPPNVLTTWAISSGTEIQSKHKSYSTPFSDTVKGHQNIESVFPVHIGLRFQWHKQRNVLIGWKQGQCPDAAIWLSLIHISEPTRPY